MGLVSSIYDNIYMTRPKNSHRGCPHDPKKACLLCVFGKRQKQKALMKEVRAFMRKAKSSSHNTN